eukprot:741843-Rhodomonas_salina.1
MLGYPEACITSVLGIHRNLSLEEHSSIGRTKSGLPDEMHRKGRAIVSIAHGTYLLEVLRTGPSAHTEHCHDPSTLSLVKSHWSQHVYLVIAALPSTLLCGEGVMTMKGTKGLAVG